MSLVPTLTVKMKILSILAKTVEKQKLNFSLGTLIHSETRVCLKYFVNGFVCKHFFPNPPQTALNLISLKMLVTLRSLTKI